MFSHLFNVVNAHKVDVEGKLLNNADEQSTEHKVTVEDLSKANVAHIAHVDAF
jgi:hypothetical protein